MTNITCHRCKKVVPDHKAESMRLASKYKATTLRLCAECFASARKLYTEWLKDAT